ncbi:14404_t:CDS:2 [Cetraspora pellucida]|uniref:14404_t:CDS:1 n=1 Tax=Cetraspora pellucida TaxID=1433469 RepID=A0ACA9LSU1_9GLOM|nr:14404_t:CDS:2 [Cetraspora pellucida]
MNLETGKSREVPKCAKCEQEFKDEENIVEGKNKSTNMSENNKIKKFKYPIGKCEALQCYLKKADKEDKELVGYSFNNSLIIDTEKNTVRPTGEREKIPTCLKCFLYEKPMMENRMAEEKIRNPGIIPYK